MIFYKKYWIESFPDSFEFFSTRKGAFKDRLIKDRAKQIASENERNLLPLHNFVPYSVRNSVKNDVISFFSFSFASCVLEEEIRLLGQVGFPQGRCINYLTPDEAHEEIRAAWQNREYSRFSFLLSVLFSRLSCCDYCVVKLICIDWKNKFPERWNITSFQLISFKNKRRKFHLGFFIFSKNFNIY